MRKGIYRTDFGNAALVSGPKARSAYDLDAGERIPIEFVRADEFIRPAEDGDDHYMGDSQEMDEYGMTSEDYRRAMMGSNEALEQ